MASVKDMSNSGIDLSTCREISDEDFAKLEGYGCRPHDGDVLLAKDGAKAAETACLIDGNTEVVLLSSIAILRPDPEIVVPAYLAYYLRSPRTVRYIKQGFMTGAAIPRIIVDDVKRLQILLPPRPAQQKMVAVLAVYDELIENNLRRIEILEEMAQAVYKEWFVNFQFPGHEDVALVGSPLGPIPEGWELRSLGDVAEYISRGISPKYDDGSDATVINQKCIRGHRVSFEPARTHTTKVKKEKQLRFGDVLINSTGVGTLGRAAQVRRPVENVTVDSHVTIVRPPASIEPEYWGRALIAREQVFEGLGAGATGQTELRKSAVEAIDLLVPRPAVTKGYSDLVRPLDELAENLSAQNANLRATRDLLLSKLVSGEIDVSGLDINTEWLTS